MRGGEKVHSRERGWSSMRKFAAAIDRTRGGISLASESQTVAVYIYIYTYARTFVYHGGE